MLHNAICLGDTTPHGGRVVSGNTSYAIFGKPVACVGNEIVCPLCKMPTVIVEGDASWMVHGRHVTVTGCKTSCGAVLIPSQGGASGDREATRPTTQAAPGVREPASINSITGDAAGYMRYRNLIYADDSLGDIPKTLHLFRTVLKLWFKGVRPHEWLTPENADRLTMYPA